MNESVNDKGVCRTAPATQGLLNMVQNFHWLVMNHDMLTQTAV